MKLKTKKFKEHVKGVEKWGIKQWIASDLWFATDAKKRGMYVELALRLLLGNILPLSVDWCHTRFSE
jgi:hypothetical protein